MFVYIHICSKGITPFYLSLNELTEIYQQLTRLNKSGVPVDFVYRGPCQLIVRVGPASNRMRLSYDPSPPMLRRGLFSHASPSLASGGVR